MDEPNTSIPWCLALLTAVALAFLALRAGRNPILWIVEGLLFGLITSTIVFGVGHAATIPFSASEQTALLVKCTVLSVAIICLTCWVLTIPLRSGNQPGPPSPPR